MTQGQQQSLPAGPPRGGEDGSHGRGPSLREIFDAYPTDAKCYQETHLAPGQLRPHWQPFVRALEQLGTDELVRRWDHAQRLIRENGIAYSPFGQPGEEIRPWQLDALPALIPGGEWEVIAAGLKQRAKLLNLILADLYGPQELIKQQILPAYALYANPGFDPDYHGLTASGQVHLHCYAADLGRAADGSWWVLSDRTEAPSGAGFALENRVVTSRMFPRIFRECFVPRLAPYFITLQETLAQLAPRHRDNPRIVLWSQGHHHVNYFEDAYLARYLGYTLVESDDLAVRGNRVWLKTLGGLLPVDVILRRPNSDCCDPLEVNRGQAGIAGLMQAVRDGHVAIANALGTGVVESPIMMAFLPALCERLLGEPLRLPGVATWWCGQPAARQYVLANLDRLWVKHAFRQRGVDRSAEQALDRANREEVIRRVEAEPERYVAQERFVRSTIPLWNQVEGTLTPAYMALRSYLVAANPGGETPVDYQVMDGGLVRTSTERGTLGVSLIAGEGSKDAWVLGSRPSESVSLLSKRSDTLELRRGSSDLPSRVADSLYWLGRQLERADSAARTLRTTVMRMTSESVPSSLMELPMLLRGMATQGQIEPGFVVEGIRNQLPSVEQALPQLVFDREQPGSLRSLVDQLFSLASKVRDRISMDGWRIILRLDEEFRLRGQCDLTDLWNMTNELIVDLTAFSGMVVESMTRTQAFRFLQLGRRLERALQVIAMAKNCFVSQPLVPPEWLQAALEVCDSLMTYRSRYLASLHLAPVLDLLLTDESNPRSLAYQLVALGRLVEDLPRDQSRPVYAAEQRLAMTLVHTIRMVNIEGLSELHRLGEVHHLAKLLDELDELLPQLSNAIAHQYLIHAGSHQLTRFPL